MNASQGPVRTSGKGKAKAKGTSRAGKTGKSIPPPQAATKTRPKAGGAPPKASGTGQASGEAASRFIDQRIRELADWRGTTLARMRALILEADPEITEEVKWLGTPVWSRGGIVCTGETYAKVVKLTFARGASVPDPKRLFNSSLEGNTRRAIDIREGEEIDARAFRELVRAAVAVNGSRAQKAKPKAPAAKPVQLLSGGNPQIAKGDCDAPVQTYIAAMPGWKSDFGTRLDALIVRTVPAVRKAVKWNSPFYGIEGRGWFLGLHVFTSYVKVAFFRGTSLRPVPPGGTPKSKETRWIDVREDEELDEAQMEEWIRQAAALPGWEPGKPS